MKRILLTIAATMMLGLSVSAQTYNMVITKADGTIQMIPADQVSQVSFFAEEPIVDVPHHFDVAVSVGEHGGMNSKNVFLNLSVADLEKGATIDFKNAGGEINDYTIETITKGKYYYQVPASADRFVKLQFKNNQMEVVQAQPFVENTYSPRSYTHAWTSDNNLVIMAANGDKNAIVWTKLNTDDMTIIAEGTLSTKLADGWDGFTTSGILTYRASDNKLFYFYYNKKGSGRSAKKESKFHVAVIDAETMNVEQDNICPIESEMAGSAYGELLQQTIFFDELGTLYLVTFSDGTNAEGKAIEKGKLFRIKKGEYNIDPTYNGFPDSDGKLLTTQYMGNGKLLTYSRNDDKGTKIASYSHYYSIVDIFAGTRTRLSFDGTEIPYSSGRFSQRSAVDRAAGKAYIGVNTESAAPCIYIYDIKTGEIKKGVDMVEGYYFDQIRIVED